MSRRLAILLTAAILALPFLMGCGPQPSQTVVDQVYLEKNRASITAYANDPLLFAHKAAELGFRGDLVVTFGPPTILGWQLDLFGLRGSATVHIEPHPMPVEQTPD